MWKRKRLLCRLKLYVRKIKHICKIWWINYYRWNYRGTFWLLVLKVCYVLFCMFFLTFWVFHPPLYIPTLSGNRWYWCDKMSNSRQSCSSESSTQSDVPSQCQSPGIHRPVPQRNCPNSHPKHNQNVHAIRALINRVFHHCYFYSIVSKNCHLVHSSPWEKKKILKYFISNRNIAYGGMDAFYWWSMFLTALTSLGDKRASLPPPQQLHNLHRIHPEPPFDVLCEWHL